MPRGHPGLPRANATVISKRGILSALAEVDNCREAQRRVLHVESSFRRSMGNHVGSLPPGDSEFKKFNTSPFVLMIQALKHRYSKLSEIEKDILPAKAFSSMETSAGRMVEEIMLPVYGWEVVPSAMHTSNSALDGRCRVRDIVKLVTLKSGPRCLNDEMSENFADAIIANCVSWAHESNVSRVEFTYGVLYGTKKQSNKKDWHILRKLSEKLPPDSFSTSPNGRWDFSFAMDGIDVDVAIRIGEDWWSYLGGNFCLLEMCVALIRACVRPGPEDPEDYVYGISDLRDIIDYVESEDYNFSILQRSQLPWLLFLMRHFCDRLED